MLSSSTAVAVPLLQRRRRKRRKILFRASLNILRAASDEKIFRQAKQKSARRVHPLRRVFVKRPQGRDDGKDSVDSPCDEFLEVPLIISSIKLQS